MDKVDLKTLSVKKRLVSKVSNEREVQKTRLQSNRNQKRATQFFASRGLDVEEDNARKTRAQRMEEFKKEKLKKKIEEQKKKLPPFRAGIVRHALNSPFKFNQKDEAPSTNKNFKFTLKTNIKPLLKFTIPQSPKFSSLARSCVNSVPRVLDNRPERPIPSQQQNAVSKPNTRSNQTRIVSTKPSVRSNLQTRSASTKPSVQNTVGRAHTESKRVINNAPGKQESQRGDKAKIDRIGFNRAEENVIQMMKDVKVGEETTGKQRQKGGRNTGRDKGQPMETVETNSIQDSIATGSHGEVDTKHEPMNQGKDEIHVNDSIEIPEFFVKSGTLKQSLRKSTPIKGPAVADSSGETGVEYQRRRINDERNLLHKYCYLWYDTLNDPKEIIPSDVRDEIDCVIGQTKLLTSDKFQQMSHLVDQYENQSCSEESGPAAAREPRILENDLDSFWDMIYIQVDLMYKKFDRLKRLQSDNWVDKEEEAAKEKKLAAAAARKAAAAAKKGPAKAAGGGKSRLADFIRTKRMQAQTNETLLNGGQEEGEGEKRIDDKEDISEMEADETKVFTGIFFKIESPVSKTASKASPKFSPHVQKSILKNKMSGMNMMAVSPLAKSLATTSLVDFVGTRSDEMKSILKKKTGKSMGTEPRGCTPRGKKICFSLDEPSTDDEVFSTPRETPQKPMRKTPFKPRPHEVEDEALSPDGEEVQNDTFSVTLCEPATSELENGVLHRSTRSSFRRGESASPTITLNDTQNGGRKNSRKSSQKSVKITFEDVSVTSNIGSKAQHEENSSLHSPQYLSVANSAPPSEFLPRKSPRVSKAPERFSFLENHINNNTPLKMRPQKLSKSRSGSDSKENRVPKDKTPRKSSNTPAKGSASRSSKKFALRPSRLVV